MKARLHGWRDRVALCLALLLCAACPWATSATGNPDQKYMFNIEPGEAAYRLNDFSTQSGLQILYDFASMRGVPITPVRGEMKPFDALDKMIKGTNIRYEFINRRTVTLTRAATDPRGAAAERKKRRSRLWMQDVPTPGDSEAPVVLIETDKPPPPPPVGTTPLLIMTRPDIEATGAISVPAIMRTLPQIFGGGPSEDTEKGREQQTNILRGSGINLRGLGAGSTLVLIKGHRLAGSGSAGMFTDVSNIPLAAVQRMEILPDSTSTLFGADAVSGVVNFVMRDKFDGAHTEAYYSGAEGGELQGSYFSQIVGGEGDTRSGMLALDFYSRDSLSAASRPQLRSDLTDFGGDNFDPLMSNPGTIVSSSGIWAIPAGQNGTALTVSQLKPGSNHHNRFDGVDFLPSQQRWTVYGTGKQAIGDQWELFADVLAGGRDVRGNGAAAATILNVPDSNPFDVNPSGEPGPVRVAYNFSKDLGPTTFDGAVSTQNFVTGVRWKSVDDWEVTASGGYARERLRLSNNNVVNSNALGVALASSDPLTAFNPFGDGSHTNRATLESLRSRAWLTARSELKSLNVTLDGRVSELSGGDAKLLLGAEMRHQSLFSEAADGSSPQVSRTDGDRDVLSTFAELRLPLVSELNKTRWARRLDLSLAARYEDYSDFGSAIAPRAGVSWTPQDWLTVRGTWSRSFRPPSLADLDENSNFAGLERMADPASASGFSDVLLWFGKNAQLQEERARSWTAGLDIEPSWLPDLTVSLTYFDILFTNRLSDPQYSGALLFDPAYKDMILRNARPEQLAELCNRSGTFPAGYCASTPATIIADLRLRNDASMRTNGIDLLARYVQRTSLGSFTYGLNGNYILQFSEARSADQPLVDMVSTPTYPVNLRLRGSLTWRRGPARMSAFVNYVNHYQDTISLQRRGVPAWTTLDLDFAYEPPLTGGWGRGTSVSVNLENALDERPPFLNNSIGIGYDQENADIRGRVISLKIGKSW